MAGRTFEAAEERRQKRIAANASHHTSHRNRRARIADKGGNPHGGGNGNGSEGGNGGGGNYSGTLTATPNVLQAGDYFDVSGCGYDTALGNVIVGFMGGSSGSPLDANGCFSVGPIPALSGDTIAPGTYPVRAYQYVHNKWTETGEQRSPSSRN